MKELNAQEAFDLMQADPEYIYLDVRSVPEFEAGHPMRAINIPIMHFAPGTGMSPNQDFAPVVEAALAKDAKLVVGCKTGGRSARACEEMSQMCFTNVANAFQLAPSASTKRATKHSPGKRGNLRVQASGW